MNVKAKLKKISNYVMDHPVEIIYSTVAGAALGYAAYTQRDRKKLLSFFNFVHDNLMDGDKHVVWTQHSKENGCEIFIGEPVRWVEETKQYVEIEKVLDKE